MEKQVIPRLRVDDLRLHAIGPFNLEVESGTCVGLGGPSGSGKSLFLRAIADIEPHSGAVYLDGTKQAAIPAPQWRRQVGLLPAESMWWFDTVGAHFSVAGEIQFRQLGFDLNVMGWPVSRLSSGERQRLALLRLLENHPRLLLLDEPTANLDEENTERVERLIFDYRKNTGAAVLWVGHQKAQLRRIADRIIGLSDGRFTERGAAS
jgi:ABC-type iron transport system FetAB ATPase subunit